MRNGKQSQRENTNGVEAQALLRWHKLHVGVYARVARRLGVDPSYVSRVANGERQSDIVEQTLLREIVSIQRRWPGVGEG